MGAILLSGGSVCSLGRTSTAADCSLAAQAAAIKAVATLRRVAKGSIGLEAAYVLMSG